MSMTAERDGLSYLRDVNPPPADHRSFAWGGGVFDTARRSYTKYVEGTIHAPRHLVMVTLRGGARRHEIRTDCGHRYDGPDRPGAVSFLPAGCERRLRLHDVAWEWASISLAPEILEQAMDDAGLAPSSAGGLRPFSNAQDPFLFGLLQEFERLHTTDGGLDAAYCETMTFALARYLVRRYGQPRRAEPVRAATLPPWRLRRISDYVDAHLDEEIRISTLAALVGVSEGHLHRAFRTTIGQTPLQFINQRRIERAIRILATEPTSVADLALRVGFTSPSHFARIFRSVTGTNPSQYRRRL